jgi:hypothetical protein
MNYKNYTAKKKNSRIEWVLFNDILTTANASYSPTYQHLAYWQRFLLSSASRCKDVLFIERILLTDIFFLLLLLLLLSWLSIKRKKLLCIHIGYVLRVLDDWICIYDRLYNKEMLSGLSSDDILCPSIEISLCIIWVIFSFIFSEE